MRKQNVIGNPVYSYSCLHVIYSWTIYCYSTVPPSARDLIAKKTSIQMETSASPIGL